MPISFAEGATAEVGPVTVSPESGAQPLKTDHRPVNWSFVFFAVCGGLFLLCVLLRLSGSSSAFWAKSLGSTDDPTGLIMGTPRLTRSDEWLFWTPATLAQLHHQPSMPIENPALGAGAAPLLMSVPVRHYSMLFRPQFWGFFMFDEEHGFSWFWNAKIFGLLIAFFLLFRELTKGRVAIAVLGSIAVSYSSLVQWFFSCPPMLPEMLASWALILVAGKSLFDESAVWRKTAAAVVFVASAINFALSCYPPFQIPLVYLGLTLFGVFVWERRARSFHGGFAWLGGTLIVAAAVMWPTFVSVKPTLEIISHTSYPGARRGTGGTMPISHLFAGLLNFFDGQRPHAEIFPNTSEASNFYPIWVPAIAGLFWRWRQKSGGHLGSAMIARSTPLCFALAAFILFFSFYTLVGLPEWFCRITGLNFVTEHRVLLAIGIAGLLLVFLSLRADGEALVKGRARLWIPAFITMAVAAYLLALQPQNQQYLTAGYFVALTGLATLLGSLYFCARPIVFACGLSGALLLNNFLVNPISEGLPLLLHTRAARHIAAIYKSDPTAGWVAFEDGTGPQFILASGARVLNGIKTVPNLDFLARLDRGGTNRGLYNRYALIVLGLPKNGETLPRFERGADDFYRVFVSPFDPAFREAGVKYAVFPRLLSSEEMGQMRLLDALPENTIWIYQMNPSLEVAEETRRPAL